VPQSQFTNEQIIREVDAGAKPADVCRRLGITDQMLYRWRHRLGGMDASKAKRLRALENENAKLKKLLADQMLENEALRTVLSKEW
jgi:putative transposase